MKSIIVVLSVICIVGVYSHQFTEEQKAIIRAEVQACIVESGVDRGSIDTFKRGDKVPPSREFDCFTACVMKKSGMMNSDGTMKSGKPTDSEASKECRKLSGADVCETAGKVMECFAKNGIRHPF